MTLYYILDKGKICLSEYDGKDWMASIDTYFDISGKGQSFIRLNEEYSFEKIKRAIRDYKPKLAARQILGFADSLPRIERMIRLKQRTDGLSPEESCAKLGAERRE